MATIRTFADLGARYAPPISQDEADLAEFLENKAIFAEESAKIVHDAPHREPNGSRQYLGPRFQPPVKKGQGRTKRWAMR